MIAMLAKRGDQRAIIPKRPLFFPTEPFENFRTPSAELSQDRARVMQFVGRRYQSSRRIRILEMLDVSSFSFQPRRLRRLVRIGATINDARNFIAKCFADIAQSFGAAAIFHGIVKKGADRFVFIRSVLERDRSDTKNMRNKRNPRFLAHLITMRVRRINERFVKFFRQLHYSICVNRDEGNLWIPALLLCVLRVSVVNFRRSLWMRFVKAILVAIFKSEVPILLIAGSLLLKILLSHHV